MSAVLSSFPPAPPSLESEPKSSSTPSSSPSSILPLPDVPDIIPKILPVGETHLLSGASGAGKTALTFQLLSSMHTGEPFFGLPVRKPAFIGYIASDRTWASHATWLRTVGLTDLPHYSLTQDSGTSGADIRVKAFGDRIQLFKRFIVKMLINSGLVDPALDGKSNTTKALTFLPKDSFIVLDPISLFVGGDPNKYDQVFSHMVDLNQFCLRYCCTLLGVAHAGKQKSDPAQRYTRPQDRIMGSTAQTGCSSTAMHLAPPTETGESWSEFVYVPHHAPADNIKLSRDPNTGLFIPMGQAVPSQQEQKKQEKKLRAPLQLLTLLPEDYSTISITDLVVSAEVSLSLSRPSVYRYLDVLVENNLVETKKPGLWGRKKSN